MKEDVLEKIATIKDEIESWEVYNKHAKMEYCWYGDEVEIDINFNNNNYISVHLHAIDVLKFAVWVANSRGYKLVKKEPEE